MENLITINLSNPVNAILFLVATILLVFLGKELKKSIIPQITLIVYVIMLILYTIQLVTFDPVVDAELIPVIYRCIAFNLMFLLLTFITYLWVDDIEAKFKKKKSIDNSLDWFWNTKV